MGVYLHCIYVCSYSVALSPGPILSFAVLHTEKLVLHTEKQATEKQAFQCATLQSWE